MTNPFFGFLTFLVTSALSIATLTLSWAQQEHVQDMTDQELKSELRNQKHIHKKEDRIGDRKRNRALNQARKSVAPNLKVKQRHINRDERAKRLTGQADTADLKATAAFNRKNDIQEEIDRRKNEKNK